MFKGGNSFCFPENIESQATKLFGELQADDLLQGLDGPAFADKAAHFLAELNAIHAFREGNGRSQLTFFILLADYAAPQDEVLDPHGEERGNAARLEPRGHRSVVMILSKPRCRCPLTPTTPSPAHG
jgi:Fic/DOC family